VGITYVYFLIFAQFGFLKYLSLAGIAGSTLKDVMGAMAAGGILASLLATQVSSRLGPVRTLQSAFAGCALAAALLWLPLNVAASLGVACLIGTSLGLLTVTLVTHLHRWTGDFEPLWKVGLGTGLGYLVCNYPPLFAASAMVQARVSGLLCLVGIAVAHRMLPEAPRPLTKAQRIEPSFVRVLACFTALVWLDSAAFYIIQNTPALKAGTWAGTVHLWANGGLHLAAALASVWLLRRAGLAVTLASAFAFLALACCLLADPARITVASAFYPVGVSLYSVALVAYPAFLTTAATDAQRGRQAGLIYAIAGWAGSALGIGMGQNLGHVPVGFVLAAGVLFVSPWLWRLLRQRRREAVITGALLMLAFTLQRFVAKPNPATTQIELGRQTYIAEGCINCHSQYVRPHSPDVLLWGPAESLNAVRQENPPLIGNRRQGPDLAEVGDRRSPLWLRAHFIDPRAVSDASFMPAYASLFRDGRGEALVAYVASLGSAQGRQDRMRIAEHWQPAASAWKESEHLDGEVLFERNCATCHVPGGPVRSRWKSQFRRLPPLFATDPLRYIPRSANADWRQARIAQIVKFGLPGTDMPGHEYLPDSEVAALAHWVARVSEK
jgi:hypothetical protein